MEIKIKEVKDIDLNELDNLEYGVLMECIISASIEINELRQAKKNKSKNIEQMKWRVKDELEGILSVINCNKNDYYVDE